MSQALLNRFLSATVSEVFHWFSSLPGVIRGDGYVYVPGTRPPSERVLLVAHADTVWTTPTKPTWHGMLAFAGSPIFDKKSDIKTRSGYSTWRSSGLGADDRAGCAMMWTFRNSGHSILITDEEERGCIGARAAAEEIPDLLSEHLFALEVDRRGDSNVVFYSVSTKEFEEWLLSTLGTGWKREQGSMSDISVICRTIGICGANLAAGYYYEHSEREFLSLDCWFRTRAGVERVLAHATQRFDLPKYEPKIVKYDSKRSSYERDPKMPASLSARIGDPDYPEKLAKWEQEWEDYLDAKYGKRIGYGKRESDVKSEHSEDTVFDGSALLDVPDEEEVSMSDDPFVEPCQSHAYAPSMCYSHLRICQVCGMYSDGSEATDDEIEFELYSSAWGQEFSYINSQALKRIAAN